MKVLVANKFGENKIVTSGHIPRVGESVDVFCRPFPTVTNVLNWPGDELLDSLGAPKDIDAIVTVD